MKYLKLIGLAAIAACALMAFAVTTEVVAVAFLGALGTVTFQIGKTQELSLKAVLTNSRATVTTCTGITTCTGATTSEDIDYRLITQPNVQLPNLPYEREDLSFTPVMAC
jgi:hypothetical protein